MESIAGFILAGGESRRMGTDKWKLMLDGRSFVKRIAGELSGVASSVSVIGNIAKSALSSALTNDAEAAQANLPIVPDIYPRWGALGGVHAALSNCSADWALVVACDFPFVTQELFVHLASLRGEFEAVAPVQLDQIPQPLCALYRVNPCGLEAEAMIESGKRKPIALLQSVKTRWVSFSEIKDLAGASRFFENINTRQDYDRILGELR